MSQTPQISTFVQNAQENAQENATKERARIRKQKTVVKWLARSELLFSIFCFCGGIAEATMEGCVTYPGSSYCTYQETLGQGIWLSVFPFIAGIFGIYVSSKTATKVQIRLLMGFSIVGSISMIIMTFLEGAMMRSYRPSPFRTLQILLICVGSVNAILLITSACMSCCLCSCCQNRQINDVMYVAYTPAANYPLQTPQPGMTANPQMVAMAPNPQMMTMAPNSQMMTMAPNSQMMTMAPNPQMMVMNGAQMQQYGFGQQGYPIMFAQPQIQQVTPQQVQPCSSTQPELPKYQPTETKTVPQTNES